MAFIFLEQMYESLMVFLLHTEYREEPGGKCFLTIVRKSLSKLVLTSLEYGGLNQITRRLLVLLWLLFLFSVSVRGTSYVSV